MCGLVYLYVVCLHGCAYAFKFKVHCGSALRPGASRLPGRAVSGGAFVTEHQGSMSYEKSRDLYRLAL